MTRRNYNVGDAYFVKTEVGMFIVIIQPNKNNYNLSSQVNILMTCWTRDSHSLTCYETVTPITNLDKYYTLLYIRDKNEE